MARHPEPHDALSRYAALRERYWAEIARSNRELDAIEAAHDALRDEVGDIVYSEIELEYDLATHPEAAK